MNTPSPQEPNLRRPHPLASELIERLRCVPAARVLEIGGGSGRNTAALTDAGYAVETIADENAHSFSTGRTFDAALSTHALLHGTPPLITQTVGAIAAVLTAGAPFYATFGSKADRRYGAGTRVDEDTFAPDAGDEQGVAHAFFDERALRRMLEAHFTIETIQEHDVDEIAGSWAHAQRLRGSVHWFVRARRNEVR